MSDCESATLTERDHVRLRPGMYVGNIDIDGLHHLAGELINNSVDEVLAGHATQISVTIHDDGSLTVEDNGRGISVERDEEQSALLERDVTTLEVLMTKLYLGRKIEKGSYKTSHGRHTIGLKVANFLSRWCEARVWRNGFEYQLRFEKGAVVGELQQLGPTNRRGTRITIQADPEIFTTTNFDFVRLQSRLRELSLLHPSLTTRIHDERTQVFQFDRGVSQLVEELSQGQLGCSEVFRLETEGHGMQVEIAFQFTLGFGQQTRLYVNDLLISNGGTPIAGLVTGITRAMPAMAKIQHCDSPSLCDEFAQRLAAVVVVRCREPQFAAATRHELMNQELIEIVASAVERFLQKRFVANPELARQQWDMARKAAERRNAGEVSMEDFED